MNKPLVELWDVKDADVAFGGGVKWPSRTDPKLNDVSEDCVRIANTLFFNGGKLADHNRTLKPGVDSARFHNCLRAVLCSFEPPHEVKEAVAGSMIEHYTDERKAALAAE